MVAMGGTAMLSALLLLAAVIASNLVAAAVARSLARGWLALPVAATAGLATALILFYGSLAAFGL